MAYIFKLSRRLAQNGVWAAAVAAVAAVACQSEPTSMRYDASTIRISPQATVISPDGAVRYSATATSLAGAQVPVAVTWTAEGGRIDQDGNFVAGQLEGVFRVRAAHPTQQWLGDSATAIVMSGPLPTALRIHPADVEVGPGVAAELMAWGIRARGDSMPLAAAFSATGGELTPDTSGAIRVLPDGEAEIQVTGAVATLSAVATVRSSHVAVASVSITPDSAALVVGGSIRLTATVRDAAGTTLPGRQVKWLTSNAAVAAVSSDGVVVGKMAGTAEVGALSEGKSDRSLIRVGAPVPVASVVVTPATASLPIGDTLRLTAVARDQSGVILQGRTFTWSSLNSQVAGVSGGNVIALKAGTTGVVAAAEGRADTAIIAVASPPPPPPPGGAPWFEENFSTYGSTAEYFSDPRGIYMETEDMNPSAIALDPTVGVSDLGLSRSLKYTFADRTTDPNRCGDFSIGRSLVLPAEVRELWVEFYIRFPTNFRTKAPSAWGCTSNPDYKLLFGVTEVSRFEVKTGVFGDSWRVGAPFNEALPTGRTVYEWDGQWHRYRVHWKLGNGNGAVRFWIDDQLVYQRTNLNTLTAPAIYRIRLGANMNQGPGYAMSYWWGRVRAWNTNPGW